MKKVILLTLFIVLVLLAFSAVLAFGAIPLTSWAIASFLDWEYYGFYEITRIESARVYFVVAFASSASGVIARVAYKLFKGGFK